MTVTVRWITRACWFFLNSCLSQCQLGFCLSVSPIFLWQSHFIALSASQYWTHYWLGASLIFSHCQSHLYLSASWVSVSVLISFLQASFICLIFVFLVFSFCLSASVSSISVPAPFFWGSLITTGSLNASLIFVSFGLILGSLLDSFLFCHFSVALSLCLTASLVSLSVLVSFCLSANHISIWVIVSFLSQY